MSLATSIRSPDYAGAAALGYGRLFTPPPSIASLLKGAYVPSTLFHGAPLYDWSGNGNDLTNLGASLSEGMPSIGITGGLEIPMTGQALITAGGGTATLITVSKTPLDASAQLIGNGGGAGQSMQQVANGVSGPAAFSLFPGNWNALIGNEGHGGCFEMTASTHAIAKTQIYRKRPFAQAYLNLSASSAAIAAGETLTIGTNTVTFVASGATGNQVAVGANGGATIASLIAFLNSNPAFGVTAALYGISGVTFVNLTATTKGPDGELAIATTSAAIALPKAKRGGATSNLVASVTGGGNAAPVGGKNNLRIGYGYVGTGYKGPSTIAFAAIVAGELTKAQLDTVYDELAAQMSDYGVVL